MPAQRVGGLIMVGDLTKCVSVHIGDTAIYARVSSAEQKSDLARQVARVAAWATSNGVLRRFGSDRGWVCSQREAAEVSRSCSGLERDHELSSSAGIGSPRSGPNMWLALSTSSIAA